MYSPDFPPDYEPDEPAWIECPECEGRRWLEDDSDCPTCGTRGEVPNDQLSEWEQDLLLTERNSL